MKESAGSTRPPDISPSLRKVLEHVSNTCINCRLCRDECEFLRTYGKPKEIADGYDPGDFGQHALAFHCSLCQLCGAVCPVGLNPADMFLAMRRETVASGHEDLSEYGAILGYEKRGTSRRYTYYALPADCDTIFFPGCTLPGSRPRQTLRLVAYLQKHIRSLGIVLDCCTKPSHDLGRGDYFAAMFGEMKDFLVANGVHAVLVACPSCHKIFSSYGKPLQVRTVYEVMAENGLPAGETVSASVCVHDPCVVRYEQPVHAAVRALIRSRGLTLAGMRHEGAKTLCCGEGGSVGFVSPALARKWTARRQAEAAGRRMITYCAGCANFLGAAAPTSHLLDLLFEPAAAMEGRTKVARAPFTYLNRLRLKRHLKRTMNAEISRERTFVAATGNSRTKPIERLARYFRRLRKPEKGKAEPL